MTANKARRARHTVLALVVTVVGLVCAGVLTVAGVRTLEDSKAGRVVGAETTQSQQLPKTSTALVGTVDEDGRLTSLVVMVLNADGLGGSIVSFAPSADSLSGNDKVLRPLGAVLAVEGPDEFRFAAEILTNLSFDVIELVDAQRFTQLITPLGDFPVRLPTGLHDASSGDAWPKGEIVMSAAEAARAVTAVDPSIADWYLEPGRTAVWQAIANRVGAGIGSEQAPPAGVPIASLDDFLRRLFAANVDHRSLTFQVIDDARVADQLPIELARAFGPVAVRAVVAHDRAEVLMVLAAIAPGRMGAPSSAPSFRIVSAFGEDDLAPLELTNADAIKRAIGPLLYLQGNIISVVNRADEAVPDVTVVEVADPSTIPAVTEIYSQLFGPIEVRPATSTIDGIDIVITLGRSYLEWLGSEPATDVAGSLDDETSDTSESTSAAG